eukprot:2473458-Rhodomonas_salina.2
MCLLASGLGPLNISVESTNTGLLLAAHLLGLACKDMISVRICNGTFRFGDATALDFFHASIRLWLTAPTTTVALRVSSWGGT